MAKYNRLLVAVDGSEESLHALREAFKLSSSWVTVVAVTPFYQGDLNLLGVPQVQKLLRQPCDLALARAEELAAAAGAVIQTMCEVGEPHERIVAVADKGDRDLIVVAPKGRGFIERVLVGSVTQRVIGFAPQDVLVVPPEAAVRWDRILVASDGSEYSRVAAHRAVELAREYGSELYVLSVLELPYRAGSEAPELAGLLLEQCQEQVREIQSQAEAEQITVRGLVREGRAHQIIVELAREADIGLIVMGSHGRTGLPRLLLGSVTERVVGHAPCPVLVAK